jgi:type I restriction-modification system DNA methylase subunit
VPPEARWPHLKAQARQPTIGQLVDDAMAGIERDNPALKGVLPKDYARPALDKQRLGQLIDLVSNIRIGDAEAAEDDGEPFGEKMQRLAAQLREQQAEAAKLDAAIAANLKELGYGG